MIAHHPHPPHCPGGLAASALESCTGLGPWFPFLKMRKLIVIPGSCFLLSQATSWTLQLLLKYRHRTVIAPLPR